jgi:hypothetical protein
MLARFRLHERLRRAACMSARDAALAEFASRPRRQDFAADEVAAACLAGQVAAVARQRQRG